MTREELETDVLALFDSLAEAERRRLFEAFVLASPFETLLDLRTRVLK